MITGTYDLFDAAMRAASYEITAGRTSMVLVPVLKWARTGRQCVDGIHVRSTDNESGLKSLALDSLILVGPTHPKWCERGEMLARERLRRGPFPHIITFDCPRWG